MQNWARPSDPAKTFIANLQKQQKTRHARTVAQKIGDTAPKVSLISKQEETAAIRLGFGPQKKGLENFKGWLQVCEETLPD